MNSVVLLATAPIRLKPNSGLVTSLPLSTLSVRGGLLRSIAEVLGVTVGLCGLARRLATLPCSHSFKAALLALVVSPVVAWGALLGGRVPPQV
jgi:hypothetical protein